MAMKVRTSDGGGIEAGWEIPAERIEFAIWGTMLAPVAVTLGLYRVFRNRLTETQQEVTTELLALPLLAASAILSWRFGGLLWPNRPLSRDELEELHRHPPGSPQAH